MYITFKGVRGVSGPPGSEGPPGPKGEKGERGLPGIADNVNNVCTYINHFPILFMNKINMSILYFLNYIIFLSPKLHPLNISNKKKNTNNNYFGLARGMYVYIVR